MKLSIIIVSWNTREKLKANLTALFKSRVDFDFEVVVVDNHSSDDSVSMVKDNFATVKLISNQENLGFAKANNQGIKMTTGEFILLLNPDMKVQSDTLAGAITWAENKPQAVVSGFKLKNEKGETVKQVRRFPRLMDQLAIVLKIPHIFPGIVHKYLSASFNYNQANKVDSVRGSFFLINRKEYRKVSGQDVSLDERYFIWFEEVDFCRQVYKLGGEVWYSPAAECLDYVGQSFNQVKRSRTQKYFRDSMLKYFAKWEKPWQSWILKIAWKFIGIFIR